MAWSRGGWIGYALLNEESQEPLGLRQVRAFIPVDTYFKVKSAAIRVRACRYKRSAQKAIQRGVYGYNQTFWSEVGQLAQSAPDATSPLFGPPFTNLQASLELGAAAFELGVRTTPLFHYVGGIFPGNDPTKIPTGLAYTDVSRWDAFLSSGSPYEASGLVRDTWAITCAKGPSGPFDDHLDDVTLPVLYVGAAGGFGRTGLYSLTLLGSTDISSDIVGFYPPAQTALDFGHVDLFFARDAAQLVWSPIEQWLAQHAPSPSPSPSATAAARATSGGAR
jgi:hypothetical protein